MANIFKKLFGDKSQRDIKEVRPFVDAVHKVYPSIEALNNDQLRAKTQEFKAKIQSEIAAEEQELAELRARIEAEYEMPVDEKQRIYKRIDELEKISYDKTQDVLNEILPEAFAVVRETARRFAENDEVVVTATEHDRDLSATRDNVNIDDDGMAHFANEWMAGGNMIKWDMIHYDVQLIGGVVLHSGKIAEMATGEGKTLVATLPVYLNALPGKGVHVVTVNDYLAKRDSEWMGMLFEFHGLTVDCIDKHEPHSDARKKAYLCDITYGTNNEFGFDYLRDNMSRNIDELVQRSHNYAIVDEVDSVLIDDARTPLIISGATEKGDDQEFDRFKPVIERLYNIQRSLVTQILAEAKRELTANIDQKPDQPGAMALLRAYRGLPKNKALIKFESEQGVKALLQKTENYYMQEQNKYMPIIDEELYFVVDEKHHTVELTEKGMDYLADLGEDRRFYQLPDIGAEIAELEKQQLTPEEKAAKKEEIYNNFAIQSERVHTVDQLLKAYTLFEKDVDYIVTEDRQVKIVDEQTGRIMEGRRWSDGLHQAVEAKENAKVEAATQTYATITLQNYFRMYKKLAGMTGTAETEAGEFWNIYKLDVVVIPTHRPVIRNDKNDLVYKTKREKFKAVIEEVERLRNAGRPVLVGTTSVETSELISKMLTMKGIKHNVLNAKLHKKEADIVAEAGEAGKVTIATNMAGRGTDIKLKAGVREAGGLAIIGTERHESRRVDRQLRGRAGRQGDPGSSLFFVSLEDDLMRLFGSERIAKVMDRMGLQEGEVIEHSMITKQIERAQKKVEEDNFGRRKHLLEYDDVMNNQRTVIYNKRRNALYGDRLSIDISNMFYDTCEMIFTDARNNRDYEAFKMEMIRVFAVDVSIDEKEFFNSKPADIVQKLYDMTYNSYQDRMKRLAELAYPFIKNIHDNTHYLNVIFPITDGVKTMQVVVPVQKSYDNGGREIQLSIEKGITLAIIDDLWKEHLRELDELKTSVQNASYEQKDPLVIYKFESFNLFETMLLNINRQISSFLSRANLPVRNEGEVHEAQQQRRRSNLRTGREEVSQNPAEQRTAPPEKVQPVHVEKKVGRNDPCPCGSGKKYKNCHGRNVAE